MEPIGALTHLYSRPAGRVQPSAIREICKLIDRPDIRSLAGGWPDPSVFPAAEVADITAALLRDKPGTVLQYGSTEGLATLRALLAERARRHDGIDCNPDHILITQGSAQGMDLACRVLIDPDDVVLCGAPSYFGGWGAVKTIGGELVGVPVDGEGIEVDRIPEVHRALTDKNKRVKGVYVVPNFQNPTGVTLSSARRKRLLTLADELDFVIFEDDPYGELRFEGEAPPSLFAMAESSRVVHLRSFSKTFSPGLRLGWAAGDGDLIRKMVTVKQFSDCVSNTLAQHMLYEFINRGYLDNQIRQNNAFYQKKRDYMLEKLSAYFPAEARWTRPQGGFFIFVYLPETIDATALLARAADSHVAFVAGEAFYPDDTGKNTLRLSYSQASIDDIDFAVETLGKLIREA